MSKKYGLCRFGWKRVSFAWVFIVFLVLFLHSKEGIAHEHDLKSQLIGFSSSISPDLSCDEWMSITDELMFTPVVSTTNAAQTIDIPLSLVKAVCENNYRTYRVKMGSDVVATLKLVISEEQGLGRLYTLKFFGAKNRFYSLGFIARDLSQSIVSVPDQQRTYLSSSDNFEGTLYYPHNWNAPIVTAGGAAIGELVLPGLNLSGIWLSNRDITPSKIELNKVGTATLAKFVKSHYRPTIDNGDNFGEYIQSKSGHTFTYQFFVSNSFNKLIKLRFPTFSNKKLSGNITQIQFTGWAGENRSLTTDQFEDIAQTLQSSIQHAVIRSKDPDQATSQIFSSRGIDTYFYQFLGAVRLAQQDSPDDPISIDGHIPDDWLLKPSQGVSTEFSALNSTASTSTSPQLFKVSDELLEDLPESNAEASGSALISTLSNVDTVDHGSWVLLDIRKKVVRDYFISNAVEAISNGWSGVFYDGTLDWADARGEIGGDGVSGSYTDEENIAWVEARTLLLIEIKAAIQAINENALLGVLTPGFYATDFINVADFAYREKVNGNWLAYSENPYERDLEVSDHFSSAWESGPRWYLRNNLFVSVKSANPMLMRTGLKWFERDSQFVSLRAFELGDFSRLFYEEYFDIIQAGSKYQEDGASFVSVWPDTGGLIGLGRAVVKGTNESTVILDMPAPLFRASDRAYLGYRQDFYFSADQEYIIPEFYNETYKLWWSSIGLIWRSANLNLDAPISINETPIYTGGRYLAVASLVSNGDITVTSLTEPSIRLRSTEDINQTLELVMVQSSVDARVWSSSLDLQSLLSSQIIETSESEFLLEFFPVSD